MTQNPFTVSTDWLLNHLGDADLSIVDASWYLPTMMLDGVPRNGKEEFDKQHIPGAVFFDVDEITEPGSDLPHTLASPEVFAEKVGALGISNNHTIVVYDGLGLFSAARAWWNFRVMGAAKVMILDGGLPQWLEDRLPIESGSAPIQPKLFEARFDEKTVASFEAMKDIVQGQGRQIVDARPHGRFTGVEPEPRAGMRSGHMPGATSLPFAALAENGKILPADDLKTVFTEAGIDLSKPVVTTCGSGVTAAALALALETIGHRDYILYDGSWAQWGGRDDTEVVTDG